MVNIYSSSSPSLFLNLTLPRLEVLFWRVLWLTVLMKSLLGLLSHTLHMLLHGLALPFYLPSCPLAYLSKVSTGGSQFWWVSVCCVCGRVYTHTLLISSISWWAAPLQRIICSGCVSSAYAEKAFPDHFCSCLLPPPCCLFLEGFCFSASHWKALSLKSQLCCQGFLETSPGQHSTVHLLLLSCSGDVYLVLSLVIVLAALPFYGSWVLLC